MGNKHTIYRKIKRLLIVATCISFLYITWECFFLPYFTSGEAKTFYFNTTASLPRGLYMKVSDGDDRPLQRGDYVMFHPNQETIFIAVDRKYIPSSDTLFLKKVGALPGDQYNIDPYNRQFKINGKYIGIAQAADSQGRKLPQLSGRYQVPKDEFLPVGTNPRSFDGRYTKTVPLSNIVCRVVPIITE